MTTPAGTSQRGAWATHVGFILAAAGSAVGLGNMWRFSYVASQGGGAAFLVLYLLFVALVGIPLMTSEFVVGRLAQESPVRAVRRLGGRAWTPLGLLFVICGAGILSYYSVIAGWTIRYAVDAVRGAIPPDTAGYFGAVSVGPDSLLGHALFMAATIFIVMGGVKRGLERSALILMPTLFVLLVGLALWGLTLPGSGAGYAYYLKPELGELFDLNILSQAAGQAFFSLSLGMGALMTYASYLRSHENLAQEAAIIALADFGVAFVAGLVVFPIIFHFDLLSQVSASNVGALFISLPGGLASLGTVGNVITTLFFVMLFFAAITSSISLLEVVVAAIIDSWQWTRTKAALVAGAAITLLGIPSAFDINILGAVDQIVGQFLLIVGGFFISLLVGYRMLPQATEELARGLGNARARNAWVVFVRYLIPVALTFVLIANAGPTWAQVRVLGHILFGN